MRIAFLGSRGIPACYSGFETFVEQIGVRLAQRGHAITVYNRIPFNRYSSSSYQGVRIVRLPTIPTKATDTIVHTTLSVLHALTGWYDIVYFCGVGNSLFAGLPKLRGMKTVVNVDGADFERAKWSGFGRWWLHRSENWAARIADTVIADNGTIQKRYSQLYGITPPVIPYGANVIASDPGQNWLQKWNLKPDEYLLYVSRLTPENAADLAIRAYLASRAKLPLVIVGDAPYQGAYIDHLKELARGSDQIIFTGFQFGPAYQQLSFHARAFILPSAIDATRPVVLDQMAFGNCLIARDTPGNLEVVADTALTFRHADPENTLADALLRAATDPALTHELGQKARERVTRHYDWEVICTKYEKLFEGLVSPRAV